MNVLGRERDGQDQSFDASKYGFFGEAQEGEDAGLEGSLEAGIDAPPEEDPGLVTEELDEAELWLSNEQDDAAPDEDISYASLFAGSQHSQPGSSAPMTSFRAPSPGSFSQSTSPHALPAALARSTPPWNGLPLGPQPMGVQHASPVGNGMDSLQMLQFQRNLLAQQQQQQQQAPRSQGMVSLADIEAQLLLQARGGPSPTFNQEPMRPGFPHLPRPGMSLPMPRPGLGTPVGSPAANGLLNAAAMRGAGLPGMGFPGQVPRFAPPRPQMGPMGMMGPRPDIFPPGLGYQQGPRNRLQSSKLMERAEIDQILRIQWKSLHGGPPYIEDYYYLAYVQKHGRNRNPRDFAPAALREMAPTERLGGEPLAYVKLEGLGKIPFSNIRRPKPLMDVAMTDESSASDEEETETIGTVVQGAEEGASEEVVEVKKAPKKKAVARPLEQEPQLAARIMIEDCMCLLLDVDDIDRLHAAYQGVRDNEGPLRQRRALLMEGFASSLRLSDSALCSHQTPGPSPRAAAASQPLTDGVFLRLMALPKGRVLLARALRLLYAPLSAGWVPAPELNGPRPTPTPTKGCSPAMRLAWALLRNVSYIFGGHTAAPLGLASLQAAQPDAQEVEERSKVAAAGVEVMQRLDSPRAVCDCIAALVSGDLINPSSSAAGQAPGSANHLLPLLPPTSANREMPWLGSIIAELLTRAQELGLASQPVAQLMGGMRGGLAVNEGHFWRDSVATLLSALQAHLNALLHLNQAAKEAGDAAAQEMTRKLVPIKLIRASLPQSSETQREELRSILFLLT
ncbi:hypothetical protein WJX84_012013 [Apatococcus fuscideae]|uniref:Uncharacterized protein n=1 Tax=Apatococcus fuscideae TaxID=2026836 RepID=A0AAW1SML7_9CHLO